MLRSGFAAGVPLKMWNMLHVDFVLGMNSIRGKQKGGGKLRENIP